MMTTSHSPAWYVARGKQKVGPFTSAKLKQLADAGELQPEEMIWREGERKWVKARSVKGLFGPVRTPPRKDEGKPRTGVLLLGGMLAALVVIAGGLLLRFLPGRDPEQKPPQVKVDTSAEHSISGQETPPPGTQTKSVTQGETTPVPETTVPSPQDPHPQPGPRPDPPPAPTTGPTPVPVPAPEPTQQPKPDAAPLLLELTPLRELPRGSSVTFSPDSRTIAIVMQQGPGAIELWDLARGEKKATLQLGLSKAPPQPVHFLSTTNVTFSPDGAKVVTGSDATLRLWDIATQQEERLLKGHIGDVTRSEYSADGQTLASCSSSKGEILIWNLSTGEVRQRIDKVTGLREMALSPDGKRLAYAASGTINVINCDDRAKVFSENKNRTVQGLTFSRDGQTLCVWGGGTVAVLDAATGKERFAEKGWGHVQLTSDGKTLAILEKHRVRFFDIPTATERAVSEPKDALGGVAFLRALSPNGNLLAGIGLAGIGNEKVILWDVKNARAFQPRLERNIHQLRSRTIEHGLSHLQRVIFSPNGKMLGAVCVGPGREWEVSIWDTGTGKQTVLLPGRRVQGKAQNVFYRLLTFSPDGAVVALGSTDGTVTLIKSDNGKVIWTIETPLHESMKYGGKLVFTADGKRLTFLPAFGGDSLPAPMVMWDAATGKELGSVPLGKVACQVTQSPDARFIACVVGSSPKQLVSVVETERRKVILEFNRIEKVEALHLIQEGKTLLVAGYGRVTLFDCVSGKEIRSFAVPGKNLLLACGGDLMAARSAEGLSFRALPEGNERLVLKGGFGSGIALSGDGRLLASVSDKVITVWELPPELMAGRGNPKEKDPVRPIPDAPNQPERKPVARDLTPAPPGTPAVADLIHTLESPDKSLETKGHALMALKLHGPAAEPAIPALKRILTGPNQGMQRSVAEVLVTIGKPAVPLLVELLNDKELRSMSIGCLKAMRKEAREAVPALLKLVAADDPLAAWYGMDALEQIGPTPTDFVPVAVAVTSKLVERKKKGAALNPDEVAKLDPVAKAKVILHPAEMGLLETTVRVLAGYGPAAKDTVPALCTILTLPTKDNSDFALEKYCILALGEIGPGAEESLPLLRSRLNHPSIGKLAETAIAKIKGDRSPLGK